MSTSVKYEFAVFQRRPLSALPRWKQWLVRRVYALVDWQTADGEEKQAICDNEATAVAICMAGGPNWFYHKLPVNQTLSGETVTLGGSRFPSADSAEFYKRLASKRLETVICPHTLELCKPHEVVNQSDLQDTARRLKAAANA